MRKFLSIVFFYFFSMCTLFAQPTEQMIKVQVAPNRSDFLYQEGKDVKFTVSVLKNNVPLENIEISYEISEDMMDSHKKGTQIIKNGSISIDAGTMNKAGFLRCQVSVKYDNKEYKGLATVGFNPMKIEPTEKLPSDFWEFWNKAKSDAAKVPMDLKMTLIPERCTDKLNVYNVSLQSFEYGNRLYGVLCVPKGGKKYPAILKLPGAGVRAYNGDTESASKGYIVFEIGIHGIPVNMTNDVYQNLYAGALKGYHSFNLDNRDSYYYKRVYLGCVRAIDFIYTLPEFDGENLISYGGSQGGGLSIVTAGLDNRVKALVSFYPALCDLTGYLHKRAGGWPHMFKKEENNVPEKIKTVPYYDVVNFARNIKVPGYYAFGYNDMVCPPTSVYSALNTINATKNISISEDTGHYAYPEIRQKSFEWLSNLLDN
jgi:cephalosporin-C deacetylase